MNFQIRAELLRLLCMAGTGALLAAFFGYPLWGAMIGLVLYGLWSFSLLNRAVNYLKNPSDEDPPEATAAWGELFDGIYHLNRRNRQEKQRLTAVIDHLHGSFSALPDAVVMIDGNGCIEWSNPSATRLLAITSPADLGQPLLNLLRDPSFIQYYESGDYSEGLKVAAPTKPDVQLEFQLTSFGKGSRILFARDISRLHHMDLMRTDFVANVSHEIRTPLTVVLGYLEMLTDMSETLPKPMQAAIISMSEQSKRMEKLVAELMVLSRLESVPLTQTTQVDLCALLSSVHQAAKETSAAKHHISLILPAAPISIEANYDELYSALSNLAFNAVRYTQTGGDITLSLTQQDRQIKIDIIDTGLGIEAHHLPRITERFYRVDRSRSLDSGGSGLGLSIVKHIMQRHGAELNITSRLGQGSCFSCVFRR